MFDDRTETHPSDEAWDEPTRPPTRVCFVGSFEGRSLACLEADGVPCWFATEIAACLGLSLERGSSELARHLAVDWADEAREGVHWLRMGEFEFAELCLALEDQGVVLPRVLADSRGTLVLLEPGVALAVERMHSALQGERLIAHLRGRVIPEIRAKGRRLRPPTALEHEVALIAGERLDLERRRWEYDLLEGLCEALEDDGQVDAEVIWAYRVVAAEVALDGELWQLKPGIEHGWLRPTEIARRHLGVTPQRVGLVITLLGLRDSKAHCKAVVNKVAGRSRSVVSHLYSPAAVGLIERELRSRGYRRVE